MAYRGVATALLVALVALGVTEAQLAHNASTTQPALAAITCGVMLGIAYYLGRTRPAPGTGQRLNLIGKILSVIPIMGLMFIPGIPGLYHLTRRRLYLRNIAIVAGTAIVQLSFQELGSSTTGSVAAMAVIQITALVLTVLMSRRLPATNPWPVGKAPLSGESTTHQLPRQAAATPDDLPPANETIDVSSLSAAARRLYWLIGSAKFGAIFLALGILAPNGPLQLSWGKAIIASVGVLAVLGIASLIQESWIRPTFALIFMLGLISAICFMPVPFGVLTGSEASVAVFGWGIWPPLFLWLYWRQRRSYGLYDAQILAASRVGHLPQRQADANTYRIPPLALWIRGSVGMICAIPVVLVGLANTAVGVVIISDWIQAALDKLYALTRGSADTLLAGFRSDEQVTVALATSPEPDAWKLQVRGDLFHWGKLGPQRVPFEEFLRIRLKIYGDVLTIHELLCPPETASAVQNASVAVMPVGVPYPSETLNEVAVLGARMPLLFLVQPIGSKPLQRWPLLARQLRDHGIVLPSIDDPVRTIGVLHQVTEENIVFVTQKRNQWGYTAVIYEIFRRIKIEKLPPVKEGSP